MLPLSLKTKQNIEKSVGISTDQISSMSTTELDTHIEKKIKKKLRIYIPRDSLLIGRGSVYIYLRRLMEMDIIDKVLSRI